MGSNTQNDKRTPGQDLTFTWKFMKNINLDAISKSSKSLMEVTLTTVLICHSCENKYQGRRKKE